MARNTRKPSQISRDRRRADRRAQLCVLLANLTHDLLPGVSRRLRVRAVQYSEDSRRFRVERLEAFQDSYNRGVIDTDFLNGVGASEDHKDVLAALQAGMTEKQARKVHRLIVGARRYLMANEIRKRVQVHSKNEFGVNPCRVVYAEVEVLGCKFTSSTTSMSYQVV